MSGCTRSVQVHTCSDDARWCVCKVRQCMGGWVSVHSRSLSPCALKVRGHSGRLSEPRASLQPGHERICGVLAVRKARVGLCGASRARRRREAVATPANKHVVTPFALRSGSSVCDAHRSTRGWIICGPACVRPSGGRGSASYCRCRSEQGEDTRVHRCLICHALAVGTCAVHRSCDSELLSSDTG